MMRLSLTDFCLEQQRRIAAISTVYIPRPSQFQVKANTRAVVVSAPVGTEPIADFRHGTVYAYERYKCRCEKCRAAKSASAKRYTTPVVPRLRNFRSRQPSLFTGVEA